MSVYQQSVCVFSFVSSVFVFVHGRRCWSLFCVRFCVCVCFRIRVCVLRVSWCVFLLCLGCVCVLILFRGVVHDVVRGVSRLCWSLRFCLYFRLRVSMFKGVCVCAKMCVNRGRYKKRDGEKRGNESGRRRQCGDEERERTVNTDDLEEEILEELGHVGCSGVTYVRSAPMKEP